AAAAAERLVEQGANVLMSWGIAGGLSPSLKSGDLVVPKCVVSERHEWNVDRSWRDRLSNALAVCGVVTGGNLWCSRMPILSIPEKQALAARGMIATDMESAAVAAIAASARVPFVAVKAICDISHHALPAMAPALLDAQGRVRPRGLIEVLRAGPRTWLQLNAVRGDFAVARAALRSAAQVVPIRVRA
ncbi:MAG: hypothetical protein ACREP1_00235, partial [Rhodanobacteraceae bacterium]